MFLPPQTHCALDEASSSPGNGLFEAQTKRSFFWGEETAGNKQMAQLMELEAETQWIASFLMTLEELHFAVNHFADDKRIYL